MGHLQNPKNTAFFVKSPCFLPDKQGIANTGLTAAASPDSGPDHLERHFLGSVFFVCIVGNYPRLFAYTSSYLLTEHSFSNQRPQIFPCSLRPKTKNLN